MSNKHFTTSEIRRQRTEREMKIRRERQRKADERRALLALQRKFDVRAGRVR